MPKTSPDKKSMWERFQETWNNFLALIMGSIRKIRTRLSGEGYAHKLDKLKEAAYDQQAGFKDHEKEFDNVVKASNMKINNLKQQMKDAANNIDHTDVKADVALDPPQKAASSAPATKKELDTNPNNEESLTSGSINNAVHNEQEKPIVKETIGKDKEASDIHNENNKEESEPDNSQENKINVQNLKTAASFVPQSLGRIQATTLAGRSPVPAFVGDPSFWSRQGHEAWDSLAAGLNVDPDDTVNSIVSSGNTEDIASLIFEIECALAGQELQKSANSVEHHDHFNIVILALWNDSLNAAHDISNNESDIGKAYIRWNLGKSEFDNRNILVKHINERIESVKSELDHETLGDTSLMKASNVWNKNTKAKFLKNLEMGLYPTNTIDVDHSKQPETDSTILDHEVLDETEGYQVVDSAPDEMDGHPDLKPHRDPDSNFDSNRGFKDQGDYDLPNQTHDRPMP